MSRTRSEILRDIAVEEDLITKANRQMDPAMYSRATRRLEQLQVELGTSTQDQCSSGPWKG